ncbi:MAG: hypothetical protein IT380_07695 [Myxococcales bacterium]|nr:hypothetical protein [Myxococcales bacterium]
MTAWVLVVLAGLSDFSRVSEKDGVTLEARKVAGSSWQEFRVTAVTIGKVSELCGRAFGSGRVEPGEPHVVSRKVLSEAPNELVTWDRIEPPLVSPRDSVVRRTRKELPGGVCRVEIHSNVKDAPPPKNGDVRIPLIDASFTFTPQEGGRVKVEHVIHTEPGGMLSPFIVEPAQRSAALGEVNRIVQASR